MKSSSCFPVIIPAAGIGSRMASTTAKQYLRINHKSILEHTISAFLEHPHIGDIIVVLHPNDQIFTTLPVSNNSRITAVTGGDKRVDSVMAGLEYLHANLLDSQQFVLVHDAARPCISATDLDKLITACMDLPPALTNKTAGAILAIPVADTIKRTGSANSTLISSTVDRTCLWQAQTPQMFRLESLVNAMKNGIASNASITDEASALELSGADVLLVEGQSSNIKVTRPSDLRLAEYYLSNQINS